MDSHASRGSIDSISVFDSLCAAAQENWSDRAALTSAVLPVFGGWAVISESQIDEIVSKSRTDVRDFDFFRSGTEVPRQTFSSSGGAANIARLLSLYAEGGTIHLSNIHRHCRHLSLLCDKLSEEKLLDVEADLWITARNLFPPYLHFDTYHIFVLQSFGTKRWKVWPIISDPDRRIDGNLTYERVGEPVLDVLLEPGDVLYLPPYAPHEVTTVNEHSVHVGIGLHQLMFSDVLNLALRRAAVCQRAAFQECQTLGRSSSEIGEDWRDFCGRLHDELADLSIEDLQRSLRDADIRDDVWSGFEGITEQIFRSLPISEDTILEPRLPRGAQVATDDEGFYRLEYPGGGSLRFPEKAKAAVDYIVSAIGPFTVADIPQDLDLDSRLVLLRRLHKAGILAAQAVKAEAVAAE